MAYGLYRYITHKQPHNGDTIRIEIYKNGFAQSATELCGVGEYWKLHYEALDQENLLSTPVQKSHIEATVRIDRDEDKQFLTDIIANDERHFYIVKKVNNVETWRGWMVNDIVEFDESPYPFHATIHAKDLSQLEASDYPFAEDREHIIVTIAGILANLGYDLPIYTYTTWTEDNITQANDFLGQIYNDNKALRIYAQAAGEDDRHIDRHTALEKVLKNYGLVLRQVEGAWRIYQLSAMNETTPLETKYDSAGVFVSATNTDLSISMDCVDTLLASGVNNIKPGIKKAKAIFNHRSNTIGSASFNFPNFLKIPDNESSVTQSHEFIANANQYINYSFHIQGSSETITKAEVESARIPISITAGQYDLQANGEWADNGNIIEYDLIVDGPELAIGDFAISTGNIPGDATSPITVTMYKIIVTDFSSVEHFLDTTYSNIEYDFVDTGASKEERSLSLINTLEQTQQIFSTVYDHGKTLYGDGPTKLDPSALRFSTTDDDLTSGTWRRRGDVNNYPFYHLLLREIIDTHRNNSKSLEARLLGGYKASKLLRIGNLLYNSDFENPDAGELGSGASITSSNAHTGTRKLRFGLTDGTTQFQPLLNLSIKAGQTYTVGFWANSFDPQPTVVGFNQSAGQGEITIPDTSGWEFFQTTFTCDADSEAWANRRDTTVDPFTANITIDGFVLVEGEKTLSGDLVPYANPLFFLGGTQNGRDGSWDAELLEITVEANSNDIFTQFYNLGGGTGGIDDESSGGGSSGGTGGGGGGVSDHGDLSGLNDPTDHPWALQTDFSNVLDWNIPDMRYVNEADIGNFLTEATADPLYLRQDNNLSDLDSVSTALVNIGLDNVRNVASYSQTEADGRFVNITGDTMTGNLDMGVNALQFDAAGGVIDFQYNTPVTDRGILRIFNSGNSVIDQLRYDTTGFNFHSNLNVMNAFTGTTADFSGALSAATLNTGHGANELYPMNQAVRTSDAVNFSKVSLAFGGNAVGTDLNFGDANTGIYQNTVDELRFAAGGQHAMSILPNAVAINTTNTNGNAFYVSGNSELNGEVILGQQANATNEAVRADRTLQFQSIAPLVFNDQSENDLTADRSWNITLLKNEPLYVNGNDLDIRNASPSQRGVVTTAAQEFAGIKTWQDNQTYLDNLSTDTFISGFAGSGWMISPDFDGAYAEFDNLTVRERMRIYELLINQIRATNGSLWVSSAAKVESVQDLGGGVWRCFMGEDQFVPFLINDLVRAQRFTGRGTYLVEAEVTNIENGSVTVTDNSTARYFDITLEANSDTPTDGMELVRFGNTTNTDRQGAVYMTADDAGAPFIDIIDGVNSFATWNQPDKTKARIGNLEGITYEGNPLDGYGVFTNRFFATDDFNVILGTSDIMKFGKDVGGAGKHGLFINSNNYWYGTGEWSVGGTDGMQYDPDTNIVSMGDNVAINWESISNVPFEGIVYNLFPNPSFEGSFVSHLGANTRIATNPPVYGTNVLEFGVSTGISQFDQIFDLGISNSSINFTAGEIYTIGFWARNGNSFDIDLGFNQSGGFGVITLPGGASMQFYQTTFTVPDPFTERFAMRTDVSTTPLDGNIQMDGVVIVRGDIDLSGDLIPYKQLPSAIGADVTENNPQDSSWLTDASSLIYENDSITRLTDLVLSNIADDANYAKVSATSVQNGLIQMTAVEGTLDDIDDGTVYGKVNQSALTPSGLMILSAATGDLDDIADGGTYEKVLATNIEAGLIQLSQSVGAVNWNTQIDGSGKPADGADVTSAQFSNSLTQIDSGVDSAHAGLTAAGNVRRIIRGADLTAGSLVTGLNMTPTFMGFYNGSQWANFFKADGSGLLANGNISWNPAGDFWLGHAANGIVYDSGTGLINMGSNVVLSWDSIDSGIPSYVKDWSGDISTAEAAAKGYTDDRVFVYSNDEYTVTDPPSIYTPKAPITSMFISSLSTGWPVPYGMAYTYWRDDNRSKQVVHDGTSNKVFERHGQADDSWTAFREIEDTAGAQAKADAAQAAAEAYADGEINGLGPFATLDQIDGANISTYIANDAITTNQLLVNQALVNDLFAVNATVSSALTIGTGGVIQSATAGAFHIDDNSASFAGGILSANASSVNFAGFTADATSLTRSIGAVDVKMGDVRASIEGFGVVQDADNEIWMGKVATDDYELAVRSGGASLVQLGSRANTIAGANIDGSGMWSNGNGNTFGGSGLFIDWINEQFSLGSDLQFDSGNATFGGALSAATGSFAGDITAATGTFTGALDVGANFSVDSNGIMTAAGATVKGRIEGEDGYLQSMNITGDITILNNAYIQNVNDNYLLHDSGMAMKAGSYENTLRFFDVNDGFTLKNAVDGVVGAGEVMGAISAANLGAENQILIRANPPIDISGNRGIVTIAAFEANFNTELIRFNGFPVNEGDFQTLGGSTDEIDIVSPSTAIFTTSTLTVDSINLAIAPVNFMRIEIINTGDHDIVFTGNGNVILRIGTSGNMIISGQSSSVLTYINGSWYKRSDHGD